MKKIIPPKVEYLYLNTDESEERLMKAYRRIFAVAKQNLILKKQALSNTC